MRLKAGGCATSTSATIACRHCYGAAGSVSPGWQLCASSFHCLAESTWGTIALGVCAQVAAAPRAHRVLDVILASATLVASRHCMQSSVRGNASSVCGHVARVFQTVSAIDVGLGPFGRHSAEICLPTGGVASLSVGAREPLFRCVVCYPRHAFGALALVCACVAWSPPRPDNEQHAHCMRGVVLVRSVVRFQVVGPVCVAGFAIGCATKCPS